MKILKKKSNFKMENLMEKMKMEQNFEKKKKKIFKLKIWKKNFLS